MISWEAERSEGRIRRGVTIVSFSGGGTEFIGFFVEGYCQSW